MVDVLTKSQRSFNMSRIRSTDTKPELTLRKHLYSSEVRGYRLHYKLPGKPDIVFLGARLVVFIDGCFWHKCPECFAIPKTRKKFWLRKLNENRKRDKKANYLLNKKGWKVMHFWEHEIKSNPTKCVDNIKRNLKI